MKQTKRLLSALLALALCLTLLPAPAGAAELAETGTPNTWVLDGNEWHYYKADGTMAQKENVRIDYNPDSVDGVVSCAWYSFDEDGRLRQDEVFQDPQDSTQWRYAFPSGSLAKAEWVRLHENDDGTLRLYQPGDLSYGWYYFFTTGAYSAPGAMLRGQHRKIGSEFYAFDENGKMYTNTWLTVEDMANTRGGAVLGTGADAPHWGEAAYMTYYGGNGQRPVNMTLPIGENHLEIWYTFDSDGKVTKVQSAYGTNYATDTNEQFPLDYIKDSVIKDPATIIDGGSSQAQVSVKRVESVTTEENSTIYYTPGDTLELKFTVTVYNEAANSSSITLDNYLFWVEAYGVDSPATPADSSK